MTLRPLADVGAADWLVSSGAHWFDLASYGPPGFASYVRLVGRGRTAQGAEGGDLDDEDVRAALVEVLALHTTSAAEAYFCLWEGGGLEGSGAQGFPDAFPPAVTRMPRVTLGMFGERCYLMFGGALGEIGQWGDDPGHGGIGGPHLFWPADHAWCVASDVDGDGSERDIRWVGVGGTSALIEALRADGRFELEHTGPDHPHPYR
ncbi:hypothetical protein [Mumia zhuanghuii]|uniref:hypothetical protein n=1 Tax=Mumia zhuanghuii TaxID=2585211 RepID=UPI00362DA14A